jgi:hypothetical protein
MKNFFYADRFLWKRGFSELFLWVTVSLENGSYRKLYLCRTIYYVKLFSCKTLPLENCTEHKKEKTAFHVKLIYDTTVFYVKPFPLRLFFIENCDYGKLYLWKTVFIENRFYEKRIS